MAHYTQSSDAIMRRYETHHKQLLTLVITRQDQTFVPSSDISLVDLELIRTSVELVGEPGYGNTGVVNGGFSNITGGTAPVLFRTTNNTMNQLHAVNEAGQTSTVNNITTENRIVSRPDINHGWVDIHIEGMTQNRHFLKDDSNIVNDVSILAPTDLGLLSARIAQANSQQTPITLENVKMQQLLKVQTRFVGNGDENGRIARFTEDFADTDPATYRFPDSGKVKYFNGAEGRNETSECQIPANCINFMVLQFKVHPRSTV